MTDEERLRMIKQQIIDDCVANLENGRMERAGLKRNILDRWPEEELSKTELSDMMQTIFDSVFDGWGSPHL